MSGSFVQTLVLTDIATGWTECAPLLVREQKLLTEVLIELRKLLPFTLLGFDTDNDSVFMNETVRNYCQEAGVAFTRCRGIVTLMAKRVQEVTSDCNAQAQAALRTHVSCRQFLNASARAC